MDNEQVLLVMASYLLSGLIATLLTLYLQRRFEKQRLKLALLADIQGHSVGDDRFIVALNKTPLIFYDSKDVVSAYEQLVASSQIPGRLLEKLVLAMIGDVRLPSRFRDVLMHRYDTGI